MIYEIIHHANEVMSKELCEIIILQGR